jgi:hypothetical protein
MSRVRQGRKKKKEISSQLGQQQLIQLTDLSNRVDDDDDDGHLMQTDILQHNYSSRSLSLTP